MEIHGLKKYCNSGGCMAKLSPGLLASVLDKIPRGNNNNLIVGYDTKDDAAVYKISEEVAIVATLDFFTPIVEEPYIFGKIAATNALSDIYAMGGDVAFALNIVCFPEDGDIDMLGEILRGGSEKVLEAGGSICGGHSINDPIPKYGLSVTGTVNPKKMLKNNECKIGDKIILTKPLGIGIVISAHKMGAASSTAYKKALDQMEALNKYAAEKMKNYDVHACTDVTGFGFLGHLHEMVNSMYSICVFTENISYIDEAYDYANEFYITSAGQRNRNYLKDKVTMENIDFAMQEILFDPQTSGGLLISVADNDYEALLNDLNTLQIKSCLVGEVVERQIKDIIVK